MHLEEHIAFNENWGDCVSNDLPSGGHKQLWFIPKIGFPYKNRNSHRCGKGFHTHTQWTKNGSWSTTSKYGKHVIGTREICRNKRQDPERIV